MKEYLKKYKELLEKNEINKKKIEENKKTLNEIYEKWQESKEKVDKLDLELKESEKEYNNLIDKKYNKLYNKLTLIQIISTIAIYIILGSSNIVWYILALPLLLAYNMIVFLGTFLISKLTNVFEKMFNKDKNVKSLAQAITDKEKELSKEKTICEECSQKIIQNHRQSKQLDNEKINIYNSINELMVSYATPIFDEQLKDISEEKNNKPLTKTKSKAK